MGSLLPYNFFITPELFWQHRLATVYDNTTTSDIAISAVPMEPVRNWMQTFWQNFLTVALCGTILTMSIITPWIERYCCQIHILGYFSMSGTVCMFVVVAVLSILDNSSWVPVYFWVNLLCASLISMFAAMYQVTGVNLASNMPGEYTESVFSGQAVAGVISSIINIISIAVTKNQEQAAVCFFFLAAGITVLVMISFHRLRQNEYFKQCQRQPFEMEDDDVYERKSITRFSITESELNIAEQVRQMLHEQEQRSTSSFLRILKDLWPEELAAFNTSFMTMSVFPGLIAQVRSSQEDTIWGDRYFVPTVTFLVFNICDYLGRLLTNFVTIWGSKTGKGLALCTFVRYAFWILFPLCNIEAKSEKIPTLLSQDWAYAILVILFGLSNGYCTALPFIYSSTKMKKMRCSQDDISIGSYLVFILFSLGLFFGTTFSFAVKYL